MERNRVLWVIFSISLFLVVVLAGGLYLLRPASEKNAELTSGQSPSLRGFDAFEYVRGKSDLPALKQEPDQAEEIVIIVGEKEEASEPVLETPEKAEPPAVDTQPQPRTSAPPAAAKPAAAAPRERVASRQPAAPVQKPSPRPRVVSVTEYWIQAGSYTSPSRAQEVAGVLEDQGLISKITTRDMSGKTYYRVRIGPYLSRAEAQKFLEWVRAVKGFESSYISMVYAKRQDP